MIALLLLTSCTTWYPVRHPAPGPLPEFYKNYYDYPHVAGEEKRLGTVETETYVMHEIEIPLNLPADLVLKNKEEFKRQTEELATRDQKTANDQKLRYTIRMDYYVPRSYKPGEKRPVILISPILGGNMVVDHFANYYAGRGYLAVIVHRKRVFWDDEREEDAPQLEEYLRTSVIRLREAVDWLEVQPEVDPKRIGAFGISYGAILHSVLAAVEPRIRYHVLAMPAGDIPDVVLNCPDKAITKLVRHVQEKYGWSREKIRVDLQGNIKTDPLLLAAAIPRDKVQVYVALFDRVVGAGRSFKLWKAMGKPKLKILPFGHYGGILVFPYLQTQSYLSFKKHLK